MKEIKTFPNQKVLTLKAHEVAPNSAGFFKAYNEDILKAAKELNGAAFKVYMYLVTTTFMGRFAFSPTAIAERVGINVRTVQDAYKELEEKGFITYKDNAPTFNWVADKYANITLSFEEQKRKFPIGNGSEYLTFTYSELIKYCKTKMPEITDSQIEYYWSQATIVE